MDSERHQSIVLSQHVGNSNSSGGIICPNLIRLSNCKSPIYEEIKEETKGDNNDFYSNSGDIEQNLLGSSQ